MSDETTQAAGSEAATTAEAPGGSVETTTTEAPNLSGQLAAERARSAKYEAEIADLRARAEAAAALQAECDRLASEVSAIAEARDLARAGWHDDEAVEAVRGYYSRIPEADRPKGGIAEYAASLRAEGAQIPRGLIGFMPQADPVRPAPVAAAAGSGRPAADPGRVSEADMAAAQRAYERTGDIAAFRAMKERYDASRRRG